MAPAYLRAPDVDTDRKAGCAGKRGYGTKAEARKASAAVGKRQYPYRCDHCDWWHNTGWRRWNKPPVAAITLRHADDEHVVLIIRVPGEIRGKGRPRFAKRGALVKAYTDDKTVSAENLIKTCAVAQIGQPMLAGALTLTMGVTVAIPASWSQRKRADALAGLVRPTGKPDLDNIAKLAADALNGIAWRDDSQIVGMTLRKAYGEQPGAIIEVGTA